MKVEIMPNRGKDDLTERLARKLPELTTETLFEGAPGAAELNAIALRCAKRPAISNLGDDEILGYDEAGAPTR